MKEPFFARLCPDDFVSLSLQSSAYRVANFGLAFNKKNLHRGASLLYIPARLICD
jgi:hypothetical protein